jgi:hypothetical protein
MKPENNIENTAGSDCHDRLVRPLHGWRSACDPLTKKDHWTYQTFSVSFFRIVPKSSGKGTKKESIGYRLSGPCSHRDDVVKRADDIVAALNDGWTPTKKSEKFRPNAKRIHPDSTPNNNE